MSQGIPPQGPVPPHLAEQFESSQEMARGKFLRIQRDTVRLSDGSQGVREYVQHPGAVMVIPMLDDGRLVMEHQFRYPVGRVMTEFPAGKLDPGESIQRCAQRELREETGFTATQWARAGLIHPVISYSTEFIDLWFARGLSAGQRDLDDGEFLDVFPASFDELMLGFQTGEITDAKTVAGILWLDRWRRGALTLDWLAALPDTSPDPNLGPAGVPGAAKV